jgi:hypothetical protein
MNDPVTISTAPPAPVSMNYSALREGGMELIRRWASESWTDHNLHDPGITLLEACSYAMTELGLRVQLDVGDLLRSDASAKSADLEPAHRVLPSGPVSAEDLRRVLLDHPLVNDAQLFLPADGEVQFYELAAGNPPLTYTPGTARIRPGGLYEVLVELGQRELNGNTYSFSVTSGGNTYEVDLALPFWDDPEAAPFRQGAVVNTAAMVLDGGQAWRALPESQSYFGRIDIGYTDAGGPAHVVTWALLRITTVLPQPGIVVPGILAAVRTAVETVAPTAPLVQFADRASRAAAAVNQLQTYLAQWRNLGEQAVRIGVARVQEIAVRARIEVTGGIDVEQLLAEIFADLDQMLSPRVRFESLAARRGTEPDTDEIYDGPLLRNGFLVSGTAAAHPSMLFVSDVLRLIMRRRSGAGTDVVTQENPVGRDIVAVTDLALTNFVNNRPITQDAEDCLTLVEVQRYRPRLSIAKSRIVLVRNDAEVAYDVERVERLVAEALDEIDQTSHTTDTSPVWPVTAGDLLPVDEYTPIQEELPAIYGVGHAVLPDSAGIARHAGVRQLQGYLLLFEQILGDVTAQLGNINRFFSADASEDTTYFTRPPFDLPGAPNLLRRFAPGGNWATFVDDPDNPVAQALHLAAETPTEVLDRRNRMLDHLLARQGEDMVAFGQELHRWAQLELAAANLPAAQQAAAIAARRDAANARLVRIKAALLHDAPGLNAFRLLANSSPLLSASPFERHVAYLTGIRDQQRRRLLTAASVNFQIVDDPPGGGQFGKRWKLFELPSSGGQVLLNSPMRFVAATDAAAVQLAQDSIRQVLRYGVDEWNYTVSTSSPFTYQLKDPSGAVIAARDVALASASDAAQALAATVDLLYRSYSAEGLLLVEHLLLRPRQAGDAFLSLPAVPPARERDPYSQRISLVLPSGYARDFSLPRSTAPLTPVTPDRFRDPEFRSHAERVIQQWCPAHLMPTVFWVDQSAAGTPASTASFDSFEQRYFDWLDTVLVPGAPAATVTAARNALVGALNAIANDIP